MTDTRKSTHRRRLGAAATRLTAGRRRTFLDTLAAGLTVTQAADAAGVHRATPYRWREEDRTFAADWTQAERAGTDTLIGEARRRAVDGVDKGIYYSGKRVDSTRAYSDTLLMFLLRQRDPSFRERPPADTAGGTDTAIRRLNDDQLNARIAALLGGPESPDCPESQDCPDSPDCPENTDCRENTDCPESGGGLDGVDDTPGGGNTKGGTG